MRFQVVLVFSSLLLGFGGARADTHAPGASAQAPPIQYLPAQYLPAKTSFVVMSGDIGATCAEFQETRLGQVFTGEVFQPLIARLKQAQLGGPLNLQPIFGFDWSALKATRQAAALATFPLGDGRAARVCLFLGSASEEATAPLPIAVAYFQSQGYSRSDSRRENTSLTILQPPASREAATPRVLFSGSDYYGVADSIEAADALLATTPADSLASDALWQANAPDPAGASRPGDLQFLLRPFELWEQSRRFSTPSKEKDTPDETYPDAPDALASSRQVGFDGVKAIVGRVAFLAADGCDWRLAGRIVADAPYEKALRLFELRSGSVPEIPDFVQANATSVSFWRWDFPLAMRGFGALFDEANERGPDGVGLFEDLLDGLRDDPEGVRVDLRSEVFAHLGPELWSVTDRAGPKTKEPPQGARAMYLTTVREQSTVADALRRFYGDDDRVTHRTTGEFDVWTVPEGASLFVEGESDSVVSVRALALGNERLFFSTDPEQLQAALEGAVDKPFNQDPAWGKLWEEIRNGEAGLAGLSKLDETMAPEYAEATKPELGTEVGPLASLWRVVLFGTLDNQVKVPVDWAPKFDTLQAGLPRASIRLVPVAGGFEISVTGQRRED